MYIVRTGASDKFNELVIDFGQNPISIINQVGLCSAQFRDPNTYIAYSRLADLMEEAARQCQQPLFGLHLAKRQSLNALGDLPMLVARAKTVGEALMRVNDYLYLHSSGVSLQLTAQGEWTQLALNIDVNSGKGVNQLMQMSVAQLASFVASLLNVDAQSWCLHLTQSEPNNLAHHDLAGLAKLRFAAPFDGIVLKTALLISRNHQDQQALDQHFDQHLSELQRRYPSDLCNQASDLISRLLATGECRIEHVAKALDLHPRTLQTRLKDSGISYRQLLQQVRQQLAEQQLSDKHSSITDIALQLGYAEIAVFSRHFKSWTGLSPRDWRAKQHANAAITVSTVVN